MYRDAVRYLRDLEPSLQSCVDAGQYSPQYLEGYKGALSCLEFAALEYESPEAEALQELYADCSSAKQELMKPICLPTSEELFGELLKVIRALALKEGVAI